MMDENKLTPYSETELEPKHWNLIKDGDLE